MFSGKYASSGGDRWHVKQSSRPYQHEHVYRACSKPVAYTLAEPELIFDEYPTADVDASVHELCTDGISGFPPFVRFDI